MPTTTNDRAATVRELKDAVTMTAKGLAAWLDTAESRAVGQTRNGGESTGHRSGRRIVDLLGTRIDDLSPDDLAQRPDCEGGHAPWRASLLSWGHDPLMT